MGNFYRSKSTDKFIKGIDQDIASGYEDPTYLGFRLRFDFDGGHINSETLMSSDPLFTKVNGNGDSAEGYLRAIGMPNRANAIKEFGASMRKLIESYPYYIQSVEGMNELWKIQGDDKDSFNNFRTAGKTLTFECLESIDLRITALADLYRKASFDEKYMREILPENLKWFSMTLDIAEIRNFHEVKKDLVNGGSRGIETNEGTATFELTDLDSLISVMSFRFHKCMFDFNESFPMKDTISMGSSEANAATSKFKVRIGSMDERNYYTLLNYVLDNNDDYIKINTNQYTKNTNNRDLGNAQLGTRPQGYYNGGSSLNKIAALGNEAMSQMNDKVKEISGAPRNLLARGKNQLSAMATGMLLGNVYGDRNKTIAEIITPFLDHGNAKDLLSIGDSVYKKPIKSVDTNINEDVYPNNSAPVYKTDDLGNVYK